VIEFKLPELGETSSRATWYGLWSSRVRRSGAGADPVMELETDKAVVEGFVVSGPLQMIRWSRKSDKIQGWPRYFHGRRSGGLRPPQRPATCTSATAATSKESSGSSRRERPWAAPPPCHPARPRGPPARWIQNAELAKHFARRSRAPHDFLGTRISEASP